MKTSDKISVTLDQRHPELNDLRHTCASLLLLKTRHLKAVSQRLGHKNVKITLQTYTHVFKEMENEIVNAMDSILFLDAEQWSLCRPC